MINFMTIVNTATSKCLRGTPHCTSINYFTRTVL